MDKTKYIVWIFIGLLALAGVYYYLVHTNPSQINHPQTGVEYKNDQYGFDFKLPDSWKGYTVVTTQWNGDTIDSQGQVHTGTLHGPEISIRHPLWTEAQPRQDIPIMIFTIQQWNDMQADKFHIGAAPINPSELGRNANYVFAIPARYNFSYLTGFEEVDQFIHGGNFSTF